MYYDKLEAYYEKVEKEVRIMERMIFKSYSIDIDFMDIIKVEPFFLQTLLDKAILQQDEEEKQMDNISIQGYESEGQQQQKQSQQLDNISIQGYESEGQEKPGEEEEKEEEEEEQGEEE